jgi:hypothetical protein
MSANGLRAGSGFTVGLLGAAIGAGTYALRGRQLNPA